MQSRKKQETRSIDVAWSLVATSLTIRHLNPTPFLKRAPIRVVAGFLRTGVFVPIILLLFSACVVKAPDAPSGTRLESPASRGGVHPPVELEVLQEEVEQHESWGRLRQAACPRRIPDRTEFRRPFPAIDILHRLQYVTISDDTSHGMYEKVIELTPSGRRDLMNDLEEEPDRYIINVAEREYLPGLERFEKAPNREDRIVAHFRWQWKALNELGARLTLWAPYSDRNEHQGRATYVRTADGWKFDELWLDVDGRDYVRGVYR